MQNQTNLPEQVTVRLWHKTQHDNFCVTEQIVKATDHSTPNGFPFVIEPYWKNYVLCIQKNGGFWNDSKEYIPWHSVSYVYIEGVD